MMDSLIAMFPDVDPETLQAVLDSCNGNVEAAVEVLLGMTTERLVASSQRPPVAVSRPIAGEEADDATRAWQMAQDEELAQQLGRQMAQDEELARQLQEQLIYEEEQQQRQLRSRLEAVARYPGTPAPASYPGAYPEVLDWASGGPPVPTQVARYGPVPATVTEAGYHPNVHRPASWGVAAPPPPPAAGEEGYGIVSGLSSAGSSVVSAVGSLWSWATAAEPAADSSAVLSAPRSDEGARTTRRPGDGAEDEPREMQTIWSHESSRGPARELVSVAGDEGTQDHSALYAAGGSGGSCSAAGSGDGSGAEVQVLTSGYAGGSGGEVRRRRGKVPQGDAEQHNDLL